MCLQLWSSVLFNTHMLTGQRETSFSGAICPVMVTGNEFVSETLNPVECLFSSSLTSFHALSITAHSSYISHNSELETMYILLIALLNATFTSFQRAMYVGYYYYYYE